MKYLLSICFFLFCLIYSAKSQSYNQNYSKGKQAGYIILTNGDKVEGELKVRGKLRNQKEIYFYEDSDLAQIFTASTIDAYYFGGTKFVSTSGQFKQIIEEGCLNIYFHYYMYYGGYLSTGGIPIVIPRRSKSIQKKFKDEPISELYNYSFRKDWSKMLADNPEIAGKILSREYKKKHMLLITQDYNEKCKEE